MIRQILKGWGIALLVMIFLTLVRYALGLGYHQ